MANIIRIGGASGSATGKGINLNTGKITLTNGNIDTTATGYRYTDYFSCPQGNVVMDFGAIYGTDAGIVMYSDTGEYVEYYQANNRYRYLNIGQYVQSGYKARLSFPTTAQRSIVLVDDTSNTVYSDFDNYYYIGRGQQTIYEDLTSLTNTFYRNTTEPVVTHVDSETVGIELTIDNHSGYEGATFNVPLTEGIYICEFDITISTDQVNTTYAWGVYTMNQSYSSLNTDYTNNVTKDSSSYNTYTAFAITTAKQHIKAPIKMMAGNTTCSLCFALAGINTTTANVIVENLKIHEV